MRQPRKLKKAIKNSIIIYDISAVPRSIDIETLWRIFSTEGVLFYDSSQGNCPKWVNKVGKRVQIINKKNYNNGNTK